jgi:hypothetical protein
MAQSVCVGGGWGGRVSRTDARGVGRHRLQPMQNRERRSDGAQPSLLGFVLCRKQRIALFLSAFPLVVPSLSW